jgi:8-oxo-dGTP diphosphatase
MSRTDINSMQDPQVNAAGGVLLRRRGVATEVAVIHRPKHADWSLPKGKLDEGEGFEEAALREVEEETGMRCDLGLELNPVRYRDGHGRSKLVRYWVMRVREGAFEPGPEVDELRWLAGGEAEALLTYEHDAALVREALAAT